MDLRPESIIGAFIAFLIIYALVRYLVRSERTLLFFKITSLICGGWIGALVGIFVVIPCDLPRWIILITTVIGAWIFYTIMKRRGYLPFCL